MVTTGSTISFLIEKTESHVIVFLLGLRFRCLGSSGRRSISSCCCGRRSTATTTGHGAKLCGSLGNQFLDVLASKLSNNLVNLVAISLDTNRAEDALDVCSRGFTTTKCGEEGSSNVTHD